METMKVICVWVLGLFLAAGPAIATSVTTFLNCDNAYVLYVSTDDTALGTQVGSQDDWTATGNFVFDLQPGVTNYIHVAATNWEGPGGLLGDLTLTDNAFQFANNSQSVLTTAAYWNVSKTGFGTDYFVPTEEWINGGGPWWGGPYFHISLCAEWLWDADFEFVGTLYFSTPVMPVASPVVSGTITLQDYQGDARVPSMTAELRKQGAATTTRTFNVDAAGGYTLSGVDPGTYDIAFKGSHWLRKVMPGVVVGSSVSGLNVSLVNGDASGDNAIGLLDLGVMKSSWGGSACRLAADLNGDHSVGLLDLAILKTNWALAGDN
jgi:hypothetical protein